MIKQHDIVDFLSRALNKYPLTPPAGGVFP